MFEMLVKNEKTKMPTSNNTITNRKLLNKQSKNLSMYGFESQDMSVDKYNKAIADTRSISTQTGGVSIIEKNERQIIRPKTAKINRYVFNIIIHKDQFRNNIMFKDSYLKNVCIPDKETIFGWKRAGDYIKWEILTTNYYVIIRYV